MEHLLPWTIAAPLLLAITLMGLEHFVPRSVRDAAAIVGSAALFILTAWLFLSVRETSLSYWAGAVHPVFEMALGIALVADPIAATFALFATLLNTVAFVFSWRYFDEVIALYHTLMLLVLSGIVGVCFAGDLFTIFVFLELASVSSFALTGYKIEGTRALQGALNYAVISSLGASLYLLGVALLYGKTGVLNLAQLGQSIQGREALLIVGIGLLGAGMMAKSGIAPFHFAHADAYTVAPTPVLLLLVGVLSPIGVYALARVYWTALQGSIGASAFGGALLTFGAVTAVWGALMSLMQRDLKRLIAFCAISHTGLILLGVGLLRAPALAGATLYAVSDGFLIGALFVCAGVFLHHFRSDEDSALVGGGRRRPVTLGVFALAGLGLAGAFPFGTDLGKLLIEQSAREAGHAWIRWVFFGSGALTAAAVMRSAGRMLGLGSQRRSRRDRQVRGTEKDARQDSAQTETESQQLPADPRQAATPWVMLTPAIILLLASVATGLSSDLYRVVAQGAVLFTDPAGYAQLLFGNAAPAAPPIVPKPTPNWLMLTAVAFCTFALAALALFYEHLSNKSQQVYDWFADRFTILEAAQSGDVADYVLWLMFGTVATCSFLALIH